ncbi:unnamed protein product [Phaedon cochleariae]|uniref:Core Histone H2A/H2B/H3 domain-containing protein n=1 Tax=Phaedon cochleariae TaxID=80249 RepID=A0A9P0DRQ8_PHACE|nr:unnamed protein product [Phaedon cochleariae]
MVKRKSTPRRGSPTKKSSTRVYRIGNKSFKLRNTTLKHIKKLQMTTASCIPKLPFSRVIREVLQERTGAGEDYRIQLAALAALQEAAELYLVQLFEDANKCAYHARRVTVNPTDMNLALEIRGVNDPGYIKEL